MNNLYEKSIASLALRRLFQQKNITRTVFAMVLMLITAVTVQAQTITNYAVSRATNGNFQDFSSGVTTILASNSTGYDTQASTVQNLPFDFWFMGVRYSEFSVNSNGGVALGSTVISGGTQAPVTTANRAILGIISGDNSILATGAQANAGFYSKTFGTAPNRTFVIDVKGHIVPWNNLTTSGNTSDYQVWFEETTNKIYYVYGAVVNRLTTASARTVFISDGNGTVSRALYVTATAPTAPATVVTSATAPTLTARIINATTVNSPYPIINGGASNGSRVVLTFDPTAAATPVAAPTGLTVSGAGSLNLTWTDASNESGYEVYYSTSGADFAINPTATSTATYGRVSVAANATSTSISGLTVGSTYYVKLFSRREGLSSAVTGSATVTALPVAPASVAVNQAGTGNIAVGSNLVPLLRLDVTASGNVGTFSLSSLSLSLASSTNSSSVGNFRIYRTTNTTFATTNQLGTGGINWSGSNVTVNLANAGTGFDFAFGGGTSYIWVAANIANSATPGTNFDLSVNGNVSFSLSAGGTTNLTPSTPDPTGTYTIFTPIGSYNASRTTGGYFAPVTSNLATYQAGTTLDDTPGALTTFPASFTFSMGGTTYTQFSATSNGQVTLGSPVIGSQASSPLAGQPVLCPVSGDNAIISNASGILPSAASRTFISGTSPNRIFVIEYTGFAIPYGSYSTDASFPSSYQVQLEETTNIVRFVYGPVLDRSTASTTVNAFISGGSASATNSIYIDGTTGLPVATGTASSITESGTTAGGAFPFISGGNDGSRIVYSFSPSGAPATVTAPGSFTSPSQTTTSINLTWTDATNENQYILWYSNTSASFDVNTVPATNTATGGRFILDANTVSQTVSGLSGTTPYYFKLVALKGTASTVVSTSASLLPEDVSVVGVAVTQVTPTNVLRNQTNVPVLRLAISTSGNANTYTVDNISLSNITSGISGIRVFRTNTTTFSSTTQVGTGAMSVSGNTLNIDASNAGAGFTTGIGGGTTYLWVTADISSSATFGGGIDFAVSGDIQFTTTVGSIALTPTTPNPTGSHTVIPVLSDYTATRSINSAFAPITSGLTDYQVGTSLDDIAGSVATLPFTFTLAGTPYTQFSANSNGQIVLGSTVIASQQSSPLAGQPVLCAISGDNAIISNSLVPSAASRTYVSGTAPNRIFVIDFTSFAIPYGSYSTDASFPSTYQVWLEETTNVVRYVYGPMLDRSTSSTSISAFISTGAASASNSMYISGTTGLPVATGTASSITETSTTAGTAFPFISGGAQGSRIAYTFTPNTLAAVSTPTGLTSTAQTTGSISLAWSDVSDEHAYILWYSNTSSSFNENAITANTGLEGKIYLDANTTAYEVTGLTSNTPYYFKLVAVKGSTSGFATLTQSVTALPVEVSSVAVTQAGTGLIGKGVTNLPLLRFTVSTIGNFSTYNLQSITLGLGTSVTAGTITGVRIYRTTTPVFSTANQVGTGAITFSGSSLTITSSNAGAGFATTYSPGTNYFWIAGNISSTAAVLATADLQVTGNILFTYGSTPGNAITPTTPNPTGNYTVGNLFEFETGAQGFANATTNTQNWVFTEMPAAGTSPNSLNTTFFSGYNSYPGPRVGSTGTKIWGTNLVNTPSLSTGAGYDAPAYGNMDLVSAPFTANGPTVVSFYEWYACYFTQYQWVRIQYTTNNGSTWTDAATVTGQITPNAWTQRTINIPSVTNDVVRVRWQYSAYFVYQPGYFFDDFIINAPLVNDVTAPTISLGSVPATPSRANRSLVNLATVTDAAPGYGVETGSTIKPRLYYKRSTDANTSTNWKSVAATNSSSPFSFVIDHSALTGGTGVVVGDFVQYFVVAQDAAPIPNVGVTPGVTVAGTRTSVNLTSANLTNVTGTIPSYEIINGPLTLDTVLFTRPNATANRGGTNQVLGLIELQVSGSLNSLSISNLTVNSNSANMTTTNISNVKLYYTGTSSTFATTTQIGSAVSLTGTGTSATMVFSGLSRALVGGSNYIWVTADVPSGATIGTTLAISQAVNSITLNNGSTSTTKPGVAKSYTGTVQVILPVLPNLAYNVTRSTSVDYTSIVGLEGTSTFGFTAGSSRDDAVSPAVNVSSVFGGFLFQGEAITSIAASTNGHLQFNNDFGLTNTYQNDFVGAIRKSFAPLYDDLYCSSTDPNNHMFWRVDGVAGNRVLTAEWVSMEQFSHAGPDLNFQVKLYEADDRIEFVYGTMVGFNGSVNKGYDYTLGIFGGVIGTGQTTTTPLAGQYLSQRFENTNNFQNNTFNISLASLPSCNSRITYTPSGSFTNGTATATTVSNTFCGAATPINLTFGASIDNCNVYKTALYSGSNTTPAICTTGVAGGADDAAWFSFYNDSPRDVVVLVNASGGFAPAIQLASSCSNALACTTTTTAGGIMQLSYTGLGAGTFYVRVHHNGTGTSGTPGSGGLGTGNFTMSVYTTATAPANDICSGALTLTPNAAETLGSTLNATSQANSPAGTGTGVDPDDDDVWYRFTATSTSATILSRGVSPFVPVVEVWRTACPDNLTSTTERLLQSNPGVATQQSNLLTGLTIGTIYYVRVYHRATGAPASGSRQFYLQVSLPRPACPTLITATAPVGGIATPTNGATNVAYDVQTAFEWTPVTFDGTITYRYYFGTSASPADNAFVTTSSASYTTPTLADGATYYFQVRTVSSTNGESQGCVNRSFTTGIRPGVPVCAVVSSPAANAVTTVTPTITWASVTNTYRYTVQVSTVANFATSVYSNTNVSSSATSLAIPAGTLSGNTTYFVRVTPRNVSGVAPSVTCNSVTFRTEVANNNASGAIALTVASSCSSTNATSTGASASSVSNGVGVSGANDDDVWFSFVPTTQNVTISVTGGTTAGTLQNPVIELALSNGSIITTFDGSTGATEIGSGNVPFADGRSYLVRVYSRSTNVSNAGTFSICVIGSTALTGNNTISGTYGSITVSSGNTLTINGTTTVGNLTVENGATLVVEGNNVVSGNIFTLAAGATLQVGSATGISSGTSATGNIQFAVRNFSTDANYVYNGSAAQVTGTGLPTRVRNLTINNTNGVALTSNTSVAEVLNIAAGTFACGTNNLTFLSSVTTTARLAQLAGGAAITGSNFTVERNAGAYNGSANTATGAYYFLGTPVTGATLSDWSISGRFSQIFTGLTRSTYTYDATTGWASGAATTAMNPGTGAQIWADQSLQRNNVPFSISGSGITTGNVDITDNAANTTTFKLVANPYPSAIDFGSVRSASTNIDNTFWVWSHVNRSYMVVTNGSSSIPVGSGGLTNVLASSQGFFVKATDAGAYSVNFREAHKTSASNTAIGRVATNPTIRMTLRGGNNVTSYASVFLQPDATRNFDTDFDGRLLSSTVNISTWSADNQRLSLNTMPNPTATDSVGINIAVNSAGTYTLSFIELSNLPAGMRVFLKDRNNGSYAEITEGFSFDLTLAANTNTNRYVLVYTPSSVNSASTNIGKELVNVFPNPSNDGNFTVRTSGFNTENATIVITDAVGKTVHTQSIEVGLAPVNNSVKATLAAGVYNVTCTTGKTRVTTKLVVNK